MDDCPTTALEALLFDMDGVLVDSRKAIARSINHALVEHGCQARGEEDLHGRIGAPLPGIFADLLAAEGADPALALSCVASYRARYGVASLVETRLFDGMAEALETLGGRYRLGVATTKPAEYARPILEVLGLAPAFEVVVGSPLDARHPVGKTAIVARALAGLGLAATPGGPERAAMIGDTHFDMQAARALGLMPVGVTWGIGSATGLREAGAVALVHTPLELVGFFG